MANEISFTINIALRNGTLTDSFTNNSTSVNQTTQQLDKAVEVVGFGAAQSLNVLSVVMASPGFAVFRNLDTVNFITIGLKPSGTYIPMIRLLAGESCMFRLDNSVGTIWAKADTAPINLYYSIYAL